MTSSRGSLAPNQFIITGRYRGDKYELFQSYDSPIALLLFEQGSYKPKIFLFKDWDYSNTTGKYRNQFLNETKAETKKKIKDGTYTLIEEWE